MKGTFLVFRDICPSIFKELLLFGNNAETRENVVPRSIPTENCDKYREELFIPPLDCKILRELIVLVPYWSDLKQQAKQAIAILLKLRCFIA